MASSAVPELRAKRTHARRSCDVCKLRKTRCELPDLGVPSSSSPLPTDKACHRCRILAIPCVVDDASRKIKPAKRSRTEDESHTATGSGQAAGSSSSTAGSNSRKSKKAASSTGAGASASASAPSNSGAVDHTLDVLHDIFPGASSLSWPPQVDTPPYGSREAAESFRTNSIKLHGRPLELLCNMLRVAYGKRAIRRTGPKQEQVEDLDLESIVEPDLRATLDAGVARLQVLHPYIEPLPFLFSTYQSDPSPSVCLLLSTVIYFASLAAPQTSVYQELRKLRHKLTQYLLLMRDSVLLALPQSFHAIQALDMLATHAPLGVLPTQLVNPQILAIARGQVSAASNIASKLKYPALVRQMLNVTKYNGWRILETDQTADLWLWLSLCVAEARYSLEDENIAKPDNLDQACTVVQELFASDYREVWGSALRNVSPVELVGRLSVCDRLARIADVIDTIVRMRAALDTAAADFSFDLVAAVNDEMGYITRRLDEQDVKHDNIMAILTPSTQGVEASWTAYRALRRRFETNKAYAAGVRALMAVMYIPGHPLATPNLPTNMQPFAKVTYALSRIVHPPDMLPILANTNNPASRAAHNWGKYRADTCKSTLAAFNENGSIISSHTPMRALIPYHDAFSIVIESAKVLVEMHAGRSLMRTNYPYMDETVALPAWTPLLVQNSEILRAFAAIGSPWGDSSFESVAKGCANLTASMIRLIHEWAEVIGKNMALQQQSGQGGQEGQQGQGQQGQGGQGQAPAPAQSMVPQEGYQSSVGEQSNAGSAGVMSGPESNGGNASGGGEFGSHPPPNPYMDTSDRWMASDHRQGHHHQPPPHTHTHTHTHDTPLHTHPHAPNPDRYVTPGQQFAPHIGTSHPLDALLSHVFNFPMGANMPDHSSPHPSGPPSTQARPSPGPGGSDVYPSVDAHQPHQPHQTQSHPPHQTHTIHQQHMWSHHPRASVDLIHHPPY